MSYIVIVENKEYGPVDEPALIQWAEEGRIIPETLLKDPDSGEKCLAANVDFLLEVFDELGKGEELNAVKRIQSRKRQKAVYDEFAAEPIIYAVDIEKSMTAYFNRVKAAIVDLFFLSILFFLNLYLNAFLVRFQIAPAMLLRSFFSSSVVVFILYYSFSFAFFKQTLGMKIFRIKVVRNKTGSKDIFLFRAFIYTILMFVFIVPNILFVFLTNVRRVIQDLLTDIAFVDVE